MSTDHELEAAAAKARRLFEHEPISLQELQEAAFAIRDRLSGNPESGARRSRQDYGVRAPDEGGRGLSEAS